MSNQRRPRRTLLLAALAGLVAGGVTLAVAEVFAALISPSSAPVLAVGSAFIDLTPRPLKDFAIENFGTNDKLVLLIGMGVVIALLAAVAGALALRRPWVGRLLVVLLGLVAVVAAVTRAAAGPLDALPSLLGTAAGVFVLDRLLDRLRATLPEPEGRATSRRGFLAATGIAAALAVVAGAGARLLGAGARNTDAARADLALPQPVTPAAAPADGVQVDAEGMTPFVTPNAEFYRIDTALTVPRIDPDEWTLRVHGLVDNEVEITFAELLERDLVETWLTLTCVSNEVGGDLVGNAKWLGLPIRELLREASPQEGADMVLSTSQDGFTAGTPLEVLLEEDRDSLLAVGMNGEPLPLEHGFPVRMVVPGLYGYVSATKWVVDLEVTKFSEKTAYWTDREWDPMGPIKTASRIDVPRSFAKVAAGEVVVAGTAWAQTRGIEKVEVQVDSGDWQEATLAEEANLDTWRQWSFVWDATSGSHTLRVRATDAAGETQGDERVRPFPNGSEGWHSVNVTVS
jgi:DMSO/TMAO reductase YedYZ molybdopterin-dependent catalytic subunit